MKVPKGRITEKGLRDNVKVGLQYVEAWLLGNGCVPLYNLMEDAATAEISRSQLWQWLKHESCLDNGTVITKELLNNMLNDSGTSICIYTLMMLHGTEFKNPQYRNKFKYNNLLNILHPFS